VRDDAVRVGAELAGRKRVGVGDALADPLPGSRGEAEEVGGVAAGDRPENGDLVVGVVGEGGDDPDVGRVRDCLALGLGSWSAEADLASRTKTVWGRLERSVVVGVGPVAGPWSAWSRRRPEAEAASTDGKLSWVARPGKMRGGMVRSATRGGTGRVRERSAPGGRSAGG
jgi:hypothetical protein